MSPTKGSKTVVAVDGMGGDFAPRELVEGAARAASQDSRLQLLLVGDEEAFRVSGADLPANVEIVGAGEAIEMCEQPAKAVREKRDASVVVAARLVREGRAGAFVSAGNTGAAMAAALLHLGRIPGISRPAIAIVVPTPRGPVVLLDAGANADSKPQHMAQFGMMGSAYAACLLGIKSPRVGLLNIGEEKSKGSRLYLAAHEELTGASSVNFVGNVEGRDLFEAKVDVAVADGFVGNMILKVMEGLAEALFTELKGTISESVTSKLGGLLLRQGLKELRAKVDYEEYGGAQLLGVNGGCIIAHGGSKAKAIANAVRVASRVIRSSVVDKIAAQAG